jgi:hypothetical protein
VAHRMHDLRCPVGFSGTRQASAPAPGVRLELGPLGRCPRPLPRAPTLEDRTILRLIMAFWGTPHDRPRERHPAGSGQNGRVTMQTEVISGAALPKEQVPRPQAQFPRKPGTVVLGMMGFRAPCCYEQVLAIVTGGNAYSPGSFGIGTNPGNHEHLSPNTRVPTEAGR